jgi:hypothetical protein
MAKKTLKSFLFDQKKNLMTAGNFSTKRRPNFIIRMGHWVSPQWMQVFVTLASVSTY